MLGAADDYRDRFKEAVEDANTYVTVYSHPTAPISRAVGIATHRATEEVPNFDRSEFVSPSPSDDTAEDAEARSTATPIADLDRGGFTDVTVELVTWDPSPDKVYEQGGPAESGIVWDVTQPMKIIDREGPFHQEAELEPGQTYRMRHVEVTEYEDALQLVIHPVTEVSEIQPGVDHAPDSDIDPDAGPGQQTGLGATATDGGEAMVPAPERDASSAAAASGATPAAPDESAVPDDATGTQANIDRIKEMLARRGTDIRRHKLIVIWSARAG